MAITITLRIEDDEAPERLSELRFIQASRVAALRDVRDTITHLLVGPDLLHGHDILPVK